MVFRDLRPTLAFKHAHSNDRFDLLRPGSADKRMRSVAGDDGGMIGDEGMCSHKLSGFLGSVCFSDRFDNGSRGRGLGRSRAVAIQSKDRFVRLVIGSYVLL